MSTVTITTPAPTLRLSPLRVEDLLQGDCGVPLFGDCNCDAKEDLALWAMFLSFDTWVLVIENIHFA